jgi:1,2-diacylglycerol 3-alpha-glucosyltransferase
MAARRRVSAQIDTSRLAAYMKIVMTTDTFWPRVNGVTVAIDSFRKELTRKGHTVRVFAPFYPPGWNGCHVPDDNAVTRLPSFSFPLSPEDRVGYPWVRRRLGQLLEEFQPDVVHSHTEFTIGFGGKAYCRRSGTAHVMTCHAYWENYLPTYLPIIPPRAARAIVAGWSRADYRHADYLTVPSRWLADLIGSYSVSCPIEVVPNGIDLEEFRLEGADLAAARQRFTEKVPCATGRPVLLYAGRLAREKNIEFLLEVMGSLRQSRPDALLLLAGRGPDETRLKECARRRGLDAHVHFAGYLDRKELTYAHSISQAFLFASKTENHSLVIMEAMACRSPVVAVKSPGTDEALCGQKGGYLVEEDVRAFTDTVLRLLGDPALRARKSEEAWETAQGWTVEKMTEKLLQVYEKSIDSLGNGRPGRALTPATSRSYWSARQRLSRRTQGKDRG